jgi:hypothetical protein
MPKATAMGANPLTVAKDIRRRLLDGSQNVKVWDENAIRNYQKQVNGVCDSLDKIAESFKEMDCGMAAIVTVEPGHVELEATGYNHVP